MPGSSRHKSSKHSTRDAREYSDSEKESYLGERKGKEDGGSNSSSRHLKDSRSGDKQKLDSRPVDVSTNLIGLGNMLCWSIDLEKGLRSTKPGCAIESIHQIGHRLIQWNNETELTNIVPGEDMLFADSILFRLADAFLSGDIKLRVSIVNVFLSLLRHAKTKHGIFSIRSTENRLKLLRRVSVLLHVDCVKSRALLFILFGCWAEFAKDVAEIRFAIFSSLTSHHVWEVRASLFAAGCFSDFSDEFGSVIFEKLLILIASQSTSPVLRITAARSFAKIGCSPLLAVTSYKAGARLLQTFIDEDVLAVMLMTLTKISLKTATLISDQVILLGSFLSQTTSSDMQARVLRCMHQIVENSACFVPSGAFPFQCLFKILDERSTPSALRREILQILFKIIAHGSPDMLLKDTKEFRRLLRYVEKATQAPLLCERLLAFECSVCIATKLNRTEILSEVDLANFSFGVAATLLDQVSVQANRLSSGTSTSEVGNELGNMLRLLLVLVGNNSKLGYFTLDKLQLIIENFVNLLDIPVVETQNSEVHKVLDIGAKGNILPPRVLMFHIHKYLVAFSEILNEYGDITEEVTCKLKYLICFVCSSTVFDCSIHTLYALIWHSHVSNNRLLSVNEESRYTDDLGKYHIKLLEGDSLVHKCAKNMLAGGDNWGAYKAGRYAACAGVWDVANFIFHNLVQGVQSDVFRGWLQVLVQVTNFEKNVKVLLYQICLCLSSDHVLKPCTLANSRQKTIARGYTEQLVEECAAIYCSDKVLEAIFVQTQTTHFQRWFLALRLKILLLMVDILKLLDLFLLLKNDIESLMNPEGNDVTYGESLLPKKNDMLFSLDGMSLRLARIADELDMAPSSFTDMDSTSLTMMSDLALSCSMLAFFTKFTTRIANRNLTENTEDSEDCLNVTIKDLVARLCHVDYENSKNLLSLLNDNGVHDTPLHLLTKPPLSKVGCILGDFLTDCRHGVKRMIELQHQSGSVRNEYAVLQLYKDGMQSLLHIAKAWMQMHLQMPKYFFRVRGSSWGCLSKAGQLSSKVGLQA